MESWKRLYLLLLLLGMGLSIVRGDVYAVIISGGRNKLFNHERYWNDCAFLYRTLRHDYHIPQQRITLLMADGDHPADDMLKAEATRFASSPTDLDGDGQPDLYLSCTRQHLDEAFNRLAQQLTADDHLFVFITDHGEIDAQSRTHLWLWGNDQLSPQELAACIGQCRPASTSILMGQCHAGAFVAPLHGQGRIVMSACAADEMSWACKDRPYDEFAYHWTCAIARHDEQGRPVASDANGDGRISMQEAFDYARQHDQRPEHPSLWAWEASAPARWWLGITTTNGIDDTPAPETTPPAVYDLQGRRKR